jgi:hypothetical protein
MILNGNTLRALRGEGALRASLSRAEIPGLDSRGFVEILNTTHGQLIQRTDDLFGSAKTGIG